jgi:hypothetical protein
MAVAYELTELPQILTAALATPKRDRAAVVRSYDETSDTFYAHFFGRGFSTYSVPVRAGDTDPLLLLVETDSDRVVGMQIEHFLRSFVPSHPRAAQWLAGAEWRSATRRAPTRPTTDADPMQELVDSLSDLAGAAD